MPTKDAAFSIPLVDFSKYLHGTEEERKACVTSIMDGFTTSGFLYLINSGIPQDQLEAVYKASAAYFALPLEEKLKTPNNDSTANRGYSAMGLEKTTNLDVDASVDEVLSLREAFPDMKESFEIGSEPGTYGDYPVKAANKANVWPDVPGFKETVTKFYKSLEDTHFELLSAIAEGLKLPKDFFKKEITEADHVLRLLHYPGVPKSAFSKKDAVRAGAHTDYGTMTLLFQDGSGGLQVQYPDGVFRDIDPVPGAIVINAADLLQIWSNKKIKSTYHRVVAPTNPIMSSEDGMYGERYSIAFFAHPDHGKLIDTLPTCYNDIEPKLYPPMMPGDWIAQRLSRTYGVKA